MLEYLFVTTLYLNALMGLASLLFAFSILQNWKNPVYLYFGLSDLFLSVWILVTLSDFFHLTPLDTVINGRLGFLLGLWILHFFFIFTFYFPAPKKHPPLVLIYLGTIVISILIFLPNFIESASVDFPFRYRVVNATLLTIYNVYFFALGGLSLVSLLKSFEHSDGIYKAQTKKVLIGTFLAVSANVIFSLVNFYYTSFDLTTIGMVFAFGVLAYIYIIFIHPKQQT